MYDVIRPDTHSDNCLLLKAAKRGDVENVKVLLSLGADSNYYTDTDHLSVRKTSFYKACVRGHIEAAKIILDHGEMPKRHIRQVFCEVAGRRGKIEVVKMLMNVRGVFSSKRENFAICFAARYGRYDIVQLFLSDPRVDPTVHGNWAVQCAAHYGRCDVLRLLLSDQRIDGTGAINYTIKPQTILVLLEDERCGIHENRELFMQHHKKEVEKYDRYVEEREDRKWAAVWCMKEMGLGWEEIMWPFSDRFEKLSPSYI